jgi:pyruvate dehydrogenase phosphatase
MPEPIRRQTDPAWPLFSDGPFWYTHLPEPALSRELARLALATSPLAGVDAVTFQPCPDPDVRNEDRWVAERWAMPDGEWTCVGVLDGALRKRYGPRMLIVDGAGHAGAETAAYAAKHLPALLHSRLRTLLAGDTDRVHLPQSISDTIQEGIRAFDDSLTAGLKGIFPESPEEIERLSDAEIRGRLADDPDGSKRAQVIRCMRGTTVVLAITDSARENVWVANLGDSVAGQFRFLWAWQSGDTWTVTVMASVDAEAAPRDVHTISRAHNAVGLEARRISDEHPGEQDIIINDRVLGALAVTRCTSPQPSARPR